MEVARRAAGHRCARPIGAGPASASRPRRRRSAIHTLRSRSCRSDPLRPRPRSVRPRGLFDSARHSRHRPRRRRSRRSRTSRSLRRRRSAGRCTRRPRAGRMPTAPHSAPRSPCGGMERARLQPGASAHAPRSGRGLRGSSPSRSRTCRRSSLARCIGPPRRRPFPAAPSPHHAVRPSLPPGTSRRRAMPPRPMRDPFSRCPPADWDGSSAHAIDARRHEPKHARARASGGPRPATAVASRGLRNASAFPPGASVKPVPGPRRDDQNPAITRASDDARARAG